MKPLRPLYIVGSGHAHPETQVSSATLEAQIPGLWEGWSQKYLGMESRRVLAPHERAVTLGVDAAQMAMTDAGWEKDSVDLVICGVTYPDQILPPSASYVAQACSREAVSFDVGAACSSNVYSLSVAIGLMAVESEFHRTLVTTIDHPTAWADYTDPHSSIFFGDSAGCVAIATSPAKDGSFEVLGVELAGEADDPESVFIHRDGHFRSDARLSLAQTFKLSRVVIDRLVAKNHIERSDISVCIPHQANKRIVDDVAEYIGVTPRNVWHNFEWAGNQGAAGLMTAFSAGWKQERGALKEGDLALWVCVGAGHTSGAALLRWTSA